MDLFTQLYWARRFGATRRFHGIRLLHEETVLHHSSNVALILIQAFENPSAKLLTAAMMHDLPEGIMGDIPAPVKRILKGEDLAFDFSILENKIFGFYHLKFPDLTPTEVKMLKAADFLDAAFTCLLERAKGNREVDWPYTNYVMFEETSHPFDSFPKLHDVWMDIRKRYGSLQKQDNPGPLWRAELVNFWFQQ